MIKSYRVFASDMDGTLLNDQKKYNKQLLAKIVKYLNQHKMRFVAATGNRYLHVKSTFSEIANQMDYVAENGAVVVASNHLIYENYLNQESLLILVKELLNNPLLANAQIILSGPKQAYINQVAPSLIQRATKFYPDLVVVNDLVQVAKATPIYKVALSWHEANDNQKQMVYLNQRFSKIRGTSSGRKGIDVISQGVSKATGLVKLQNYYGLKFQDLMAFGDSGNDLEMLHCAGCGVAVKNAEDPVKKAADVLLDETNNQNAVLHAIQKNLVANGAPATYFTSNYKHEV